MNRKAMVIHLARATGRAPYVDRLQKNCPLDSEIVDAVDGKKLSAREIASVYQREMYRPRYPFKLRPAEIGCFLSHRKCWQKIVDENLDYGLIFEDDAGLDPEKAMAAIALAEEHIESAGYIQFPVRAARNRLRRVAEKDGTSLFLPDVIQLRLSGQLVSKQAAQRLLSVTEKFDRPVDTFLQMHWITKIAPMFVVPSGLSDFAQASGGSTIGQSKSLMERVSREVKRFEYRRSIKRLSRRHLTAG